MSGGHYLLPVPEISRFFGIVVTMYYDDHRPPHFHARYAGNEATVAFSPLAVLDGSLPPRALALVMEWASLHRDELAADWFLARSQQPLEPIEPLA